MNDLSWLIYFANIVDNIKGFFGVVGALFGAGCIFLIMFCSIETHWGRLNFIITLCLFFFSFGFISTAIFIPNKDTIYMIGASEATERGFDKLGELAEDESSLVYKGLKKLEEVFELDSVKVK